MLKRLLVGLVLGAVLGGLAAAAVIRGLGIVAFGSGFQAVLAYLFAAGTGVVVGLVAGKPIWSKGGQIEAGLKAVAGAAVAALGMFALRTWGVQNVDLAAIGAGSGAIGLLPATTLPIVAAILGGFFEADNTGGDADDVGAKRGVRVAESKRGVRVDAGASDEFDEDAQVSRRTGKKR
ncbi:MAG: hypothetical protein U0169_01465 [Polyangiaceae bacterium]